MAKSGRDGDNTIRHQVLTSAKKLFIAQGYTKTTIRQIVEDSGVLIGSIYYFFKNKSEIFQSLMQEIANQSMELLESRFGTEEAIKKFAILVLLELEAVDLHDKIRESFFEAYSTVDSFEKDVQRMAVIAQALFGGVLEEHIEKGILLKGAVRSYIAAYDFIGPVDRKKLRQLLVKDMLLMYGASVDELSLLLENLEALLPDIRTVAEELIHRVYVG